MTAYYNEIDTFAAQLLRNLITENLIPAGDVDERDIRDVIPSDLAGYTQCHFFAGIGGWSFALRLAGWPDDRPVWTGSCPCQPFSQAGKRRGNADERHLWPEFHRLISQCRPSVCFGEQVASAPGRDWMRSVRSDLETLGYRCAAADLCAASVGAPHVRQRLWWVSYSDSNSEERRALAEQERRDWSAPKMAANIYPSGGKWTIESRPFPLAHGIPNRVEKLHALGNAIVPQVAAEFITAFMEVIP